MLGLLDYSTTYRWRVRAYNPDIDTYSGWEDTIFSVGIGTAIEEAETPLIYTLQQNYPNPFYSTTTITFELPEPSSVSLSLYDLLGRKIAVIASGNYPAGEFTVTWDARELPAGLYFYTLHANSFSETKKLVLLN